MLRLKSFFTLNRFSSFLRSWYIYIILIIIYVPLIFIVALSFTGQSSKENIVLNFDNVSGINYTSLFFNNEFITSFVNSLLVAIVVVPVSLVIAILTSFAMWYSKSNKFKKTIGFTTSANIALPDIIFGIGLTLLFSSVWIPLGLTYGYGSVVLSHIAFCTPYAIVILYPRLLKLNKNWINASNDLGASNIKTFFKIIIPFLIPSIISATIIVFAMSFDDFIITSLVRGNFTTISTSIYQSSKGIKAWIVTFGAIMIIIFIFGSIILAIQKKIKLSKKENIRKFNYEKNAIKR